MAVLKETRSFRPFKSSEEYLYAMKEDLAEWLNVLYPDLMINVDNFMDRLDTGVALCKHANAVRASADEYLVRRAARRASMVTSTMSTIALPITEHGSVHFLKAARAGTFFARDNVSNFIDWCRRGLGVFECLLFETDDLIMRKNEKHVILCLLEVARRGARFGMLAPMLVQLEREIDREIAADQRAMNGGVGDQQTLEEDSSDEEEMREVQYGPMPQIVTNDLKSLDEMVRELVERCHCPVQFPMIRVSEGKYRIGDTKVLIFVRILRNHVMVRVGGGWDTLSHYLDKHDPCRCKTAHRAPVSTKLILKNGGTMELNHAQVFYERSPPRTRRSSTSSISSTGRPDIAAPAVAAPVASTLAAPVGRPRSRSPRKEQHNLSVASTAASRARSRSPTPRLQEPVSRSRSPQPPGKIIDVEATKTENDSGSEVSDEGYRSLGMVVVTNQPEKNNNKIIVNGEEKVIEKRGSVDSTRSKRTSFSSHTSEDPTTTTVETLITIPDDNAKENTTPTMPKKTSLPMPESRRSTPSPVTTQRRRSIEEPTPTLAPRRSGVYRSLKADPRTEKNSTWSSRSKQRPALTPNTFTNTKPSGFTRNSVQRSSLGSSHSTPTRKTNTARGGGSTSLNTSPTRDISPLVKQILDVNDLGDDVKVLDKMREIILQHQGYLDERCVEEGLPQGPELDFTSAWVHSNGSLQGMHDGVKRQAAPRKESKNEGFVSKIPAPITRRASSVDITREA